MVYELSHREEIKAIREWAKRMPIIRIHCDYFFMKHKLFCIDGRLKKMDPHNRQKAVFDAIAKMIGVDDSLFRSWSAETFTGSKHFVNIQLSSPDEE